MIFLTFIFQTWISYLLSTVHAPNMYMQGRVSQNFDLGFCYDLKCKKMLRIMLICFLNNIEKQLRPI